LNSYEKLFGYVPQENSLLIGTIKEAVSFFDEKVDEEKLQKSLTIANCDFVATLPEKENTRLGEKGAGLSLGQLQRLSIARAIYSDAPILLMDEATASLDEESENIVLENISQLENKTLIMVTHHHDNYRYFSKVLNMEEQL
jgi:ATP-binding cassette subfamily B protein